MIEQHFPSHEVLEHRSEIALRIRASGFSELLAEAGHALAGIQLAGADCVPGGPAREVRIPARDHAALLVDWLNELIFLAETERWVGLEFEVRSADEQGVVAVVSGVTLEQAPSRVKAATMHGLRLTRVPHGLEAEVLLDV
jgi:SHS2 domain-containing protein